MGNLLNGAVVGAGASVVAGAAAWLGYKNARRGKEVQNAAKWGGVALGAIAVTGLGIAGGLRGFSHVPGRNMVRTLNVMRHITVQTTLLIGGAVAGFAGSFILIDKEELQKPALGVASALGVGTVAVLLRSTVKYGVKSTLMATGRIFVKWGLAPTAGAVVGIAALIWLMIAGSESNK